MHIRTWSYKGWIKCFNMICSHYYLDRERDNSIGNPWIYHMQRFMMSSGVELNGKKWPFFTETEDSKKDLVKVATQEKAYKCLEICYAS